MRPTILKKLTEIEKEHHIKILYSCESGSRGWLFPSIDSDYDVRFIYVRPTNHYLSISKETDHLSFPINDELDIYGWDLKKVLALMMKSNTTPFEWLRSPITYINDEHFGSSLWSLCPEFFSQRINAFHYLGIAKGALNTLTVNDEIKIKKLFYVLRPLLSAKWCLEKNEIAPMEIVSLMELVPPHLKEMINSLVAFKAGHKESLLIRIDKKLKDYIEDEFANCETKAKSLTKSVFDPKLLNTFFLKTIYRYDN